MMLLCCWHDVNPMMIQEDHGDRLVARRANSMSPCHPCNYKGLSKESYLHFRRVHQTPEGRYLGFTQLYRHNTNSTVDILLFMTSLVQIDVS